MVKLGLKLMFRRTLTDEGVPQLTLEEALAREDVSIVIVATEPQLHEQSARKVLEAGKHCLVDYPLALSSAAAKKLYQLAQSKGVQLREENIGILSKSTKYLKEEIAKRPPISNAEILLLGKYNGWIEDWDRSGGPFVSASGLVQTAMFLFGPLKMSRATLHKEADQYSIIAHLLFGDDRPLSLTLERVRGGDKRKHDYILRFEDGSVIDSFPDHVMQRPGPGEFGLFMKDLIQFVEEIEGSRDPSEGIQRSVQSLELAEEIHSEVGV